MQKNRLEAFSDGVLAILITIMVLDLKIPNGRTLADLLNLRYVFLCYLLSFIYLAIYWNNHHHLFHAIKKINGAILWANTHLLFWLSLIPFVTAWAGEHNFSPLPTALYGFILFMAAIAYYILVHVLIKQEGKESLLLKAIGRDLKGKISIILYGVAFFLAWYTPAISLAIYALVAIIWIIPDKRIERYLSE